MNVRVIGADETAATAAAGNELQAVAAKSKLFTVSAYNNEAADTLYLQAHDVASAEDLEADTSVPVLVAPVFAGMAGGFGFVAGKLFTKGIYLCFSSAPTVWTVSGEGLISADFRRE